MGGQGDAASAAAGAKPANEAAPLRATARQRFEESANRFGQAVESLGQKWRASPPEDQPGVRQWLGLARCGQAGMLLRVGKPKEAAEVVMPVVTEAAYADTGYRPLALYHLGHARLDLKEYAGAGKMLGQLAPFDQDFGPHARYLLARVHDLMDDRALAAKQYEASVTAYEAAQKAAKLSLQQNAAALPADRRAYLESLAAGAAPDFVSRALFHQAMLLSAEGKFAEARDLFAKFVTSSKDHPLADEARTRVGYCQLQSRQFKEAVDTLTPLKDHPKLGDQASWWLAKAQMAQADANDPAATENAAKAAAGLLRTAADRAGAAANAGDTDAKPRRALILGDLAEALLTAKQFRESASILQTIFTENVIPERAEEAAQRLCAALHLAGAYNESDEAAVRFEQKYPKSTLMPAVWFTTAQNAFLTAGALADKPDAPKAELDRLFGVAIARHQKLIAKYPEFAMVNAARQGVGVSYYRMGKYELAAATLGQIPDAERSGDLANVSYVQADALIRTFGPEADDAITAAGLLQRAEQAAKLMESFAAANPKSPLTPDAVLKYGYCYQRMADLLADKPEHDKAIAVAREAYEKHQREFRDHPTSPIVVFQRAKLLATAGDIGSAINELRRFLNPPFSGAPNASLAVIRLASLLRSQNQAKEAVDLLAKTRAEQEQNLARDPQRAPWIATLGYEQALALKELNKLAEAQQLFEAVAAKHPTLPEGVSAIWQAVQCRRGQAADRIAAARQKLSQPSVKPDEANAAVAALQQTLSQSASMYEPLAALAARYGAKDISSEPHLRVLYEMAWCDRTLGEAEVELARQRARQAARETAAARIAKSAPGQPAAAALSPDVPASEVPLTDAEKRARERYGKVISAGGAHPLAAQAMSELAELHGDRGQYDSAIDLLNKALLTAPPAELAQKVRLRLAACFLGKSDSSTALAAAKPVMESAKPGTPPSRLSAEARFLCGEAMIQQKDWPKAIELLTPFRDADPYRNIAGVSDRALLRLGQALAGAGQWDLSRQACEAVIQRFAGSDWVDEARFGIGWAMQNKGQYDEAVNQYTEVTRRTLAEVAARAQVHIGLCRIAQKRYPEATAALLGVPYLYDYPEWSAAACAEAARVFKMQ